MAEASVPFNDSKQSLQLLTARYQPGNVLMKQAVSEMDISNRLRNYGLFCGESVVLINNSFKFTPQRNSQNITPNNNLVVSHCET